MNWSLIEPLKPKKASRITFSMKAGRKSPKFCISIPSVIAAGLGFDNVEACDIFIGHGSDANQLWIKPNESGATKFTRMKHCILARMDVFEGVEVKDASENVEHEASVQGGFTFAIPTFASHPVEAPKVMPPAPAPAPPPVSKPKPEVNLELQMKDNNLVFGSKTVLLTKTQKAVAELLYLDFGERVSGFDLLAALKKVIPITIASSEAVREACIGLRNAIKREGLPFVVNEYKGTKGSAWELAAKP